MFIPYENLSWIRSIHLSERIVLVGGCYDLLHIGHVRFLEKCHALGDVLVVAVSSDKRIRERKGPMRPIISQGERGHMLAALRCVDYATIAPDPDQIQDVPTKRVIDRLGPDIFATADERFHVYAESLRSIGVDVQYVEEVRLTSTTEIIERIVATAEGA